MKNCFKDLAAVPDGEYLADIYKGMGSIRIECVRVEGSDNLASLFAFSLVVVVVLCALWVRRSSEFSIEEYYD